MQSHRFFLIFCFAFVSWYPTTARALQAEDWRSTGDEWIFRLTEQSNFQEGCFEPCLCPLQSQVGLRGVVALRRLGVVNGIEEYAVDDVSFSFPLNHPGGRIIGSGRYEVGSPDPITLMQHRMVLELQVGADPPQRFDSGWVPITDFNALSIRLSINGMFCWDRVIEINALPVPREEIQPYRLVAGSSFQRGCFDPCDCPLGAEVPMAGTFGLIELTSSLALTEFAVVDARWHILSDLAAHAIPISGFGVYRLLGDFVAQHQLILDLVIGDEPRAHFDSGVLFGGSLLPIDAVVTINNFECMDTVLHVIGEPDKRELCQLDSQETCPAGSFCKLPVGHCAADALGVCTPVPQSCPDNWDPVCGCDGKTYGNECEADVASVSVRHIGACPAACVVDSDCEAADQFCKYPEGTCGTSSNTVGVCTIRPDACLTVWQPVCGCDGTTYVNECEADQAGMSLLHRGPCETDCRPTDDGFACTKVLCSDIPEEQCIPTVLHLDVATGAVTVQACGCLNFNLCHVEFGNATPFPVGDCPAGQSCQVFGTDTDGDGIEDLFMADCVPALLGACCLDIDDGPIPFDTCMTLDEASCIIEGGLFHPVNTACSDVQACCLPTPNGLSSCFDMNPMCCADSGGVAKGFGSTCSDATTCGEVCGGIAGIECSDPADFCKLPIGGCCCDFMGVCTSMPTGGCPEIWAPVCGCDGLTYSNECEADAAGVSIDHLSVCQIGACCSDVGGTPLPLPICTLVTQEECGDGRFAGVGTSCQPAEACCLPLTGMMTCLETDPFCCEAFGGVSRGPNSTCTATDTCVRTCTDPDDSECEPNEFCEFPTGSCGSDPNVVGICSIRPDPCTEEFDPVCGCDGVTYSNACQAHAAGVSISHPGPCMDCVAVRNLSGPEPTFCPGEPKKVRIALDPQGAVAIAVEDLPPAGWIVANISDNGVLDAATGKVKWGPLFAPFPLELSYEVIALNVATLASCFHGIVSADGFTQAICGDECVSESCCLDPPPLPVDTPQPSCELCSDSDCASCVGAVCEDGRVTLCELIGYACAWKRGCNDDITGVSRSAFIWRTGECYCWDTNEQNWFPVACDPDGRPCCDVAPVAMAGPRTEDPSPSSLDVGSASVRETAVPMRRFGGTRERKVSVKIEAPDNVLAIAVEIEIPTGVKVGSISDGGIWDADNRKVKWGPFTQALSRSVSFSYGASGSARSQDTRSTGFKGTISFDGLNQPFVVK